MKGLKTILFGISIIFVGGFILVTESVTLGTIGEFVILGIGVGISYKGLNMKE